MSDSPTSFVAGFDYLSFDSGLALSLHRNTSCKEVSPTSFVTGFDFLSFDSGAFFALELAKKYFMQGRGSKVAGLGQ